MDSVRSKIEDVRTINGSANIGFRTYGDDHFNLWKEKEVSYRINPKYMDSQERLKPAMRTVLLSWLYQVKDNASMPIESFFTAVNILDRYSEITQIDTKKYQAIGAMCLHLGGMCSDDKAFSLNYYVELMDGGAKKDELCQLTFEIPSRLKFDMNMPTVMDFIYALRDTLKPHTRIDLMTNYLALLSAFIMEILEYTTSMIATACIVLANYDFDAKYWNETLEYYTGYNLSHPDLKRCIELIHDLRVKEFNTPFKQKLSVSREFSDLLHRRISIRKPKELFEFPKDNMDTSCPSPSVSPRTSLDPTSPSAKICIL